MFSANDRRTRSHQLPAVDCVRLIRFVQGLSRIRNNRNNISTANQITINRAIAQFGRDLRDAGRDATGLFYYAGHAVQSFGNNYLLPVDASLTDAADLSLVAVPAQAVAQVRFCTFREPACRPRSRIRPDERAPCSSSAPSWRAQDRVLRTPPRRAEGIS